MVSKKQRTRGHAADKPTVDELLVPRRRMNRVSADFLKIDLDTALTFVKIAQQTKDDSRKTRNRRAARKAYDTVLKFANKVDLTTRDGQLVRQGLAQLRIELEGLGETF